MRILVLIFTLLALLGQGLPAEAGPAGRLRFASTAEVPPVTSQTAYWGAKTLVGNGGYEVVGLAPGAVISAPDTTNYYWNATNRWVVPKLGANKTYNLSRGGVPLPASEVFTITDADGVVFTITNVVDATRAGNYTWRWRNGDSTGSTSGTIQLLRAWADSVYGDELVMRGGTTLNTTGDCVTGCSAGTSTLFNGTQQFRFACNLGNCTSSAGFTGSNYRVVRPELGYRNTIGPISFESTQLVGFKFQGFNIDGEAASYSGYLLSTALATSPAGPGPSDVIFDDLTITGNSTDPYGKNRPDGLRICQDCKTQFINSEIAYTRNGISTLHGLGTSSDVFAGSVAPNSGELVISNNYLHDIGRDSIATQCPRYMTVENNLFTDQRTEITVGTAPNWANPFSSTVQPHSDKFQLNMQQATTNVCAYNLYPGMVIRNNRFLRGQGIDSLPFWSTANGFPNPNTYNGGVPAQALVPDPTVSAGDAQGIVTTNAAADCPVIAPPLCTAADRKLVGGSTPRTYVATFQNVDVSYNTVVVSYSGGIVLWGIDGGSVVGNAVVQPRVATSTNLETWSGFGNSSLLIYNVAGTETIARNISGTSAQIGGGYAGAPFPPTAAQIVEVGIAGLVANFNAPNSNLSPRTGAEYDLAYRPLPGADVEISAGVFAGPVCPNGTSAMPVSGVCP